METLNKQTLEIDLRKQNLITIPQFIQGDTNILEFVMKDNGADADLSNVGKVIVNFKRYDKNVTSRLLTTSGNQVTYEIGQEEMEKPGTGEIELQFYNTDNTKRISTLKFKVIIIASIGQAESLTGEKGKSLLQELLIQGDYAQDQGDYAKAQGDYAKAQGDNAQTNWLAPVADFAAVTAIASPQFGDTVQTLSDGKVYRYEGAEWIYTQGYSSTAIADVNAQLAETGKEVIRASRLPSSFAPIKTKRPLVSFVDDDGNKAVLTKLLPLAETYGIPFTVCMPLDFMVNGNGMSPEELRTLQDQHGFEIASHAKTHTPINSEMTEGQQYIEVYESWRGMREHGLNIETIVYPFGQSTPYAREVASRYYKAGVSTDTRFNNSPISTYRLGRIGFPSGDKTLEYYKSKVDEAVATNSWLIWMLHCGAAEHDAGQQAILEELIQYINSLDIPVVNVTEGIDIRGNVLDFNEQQLFLSHDGKNNIRDLIYEPSDPVTGIEKYTCTNLPSDFPENKVVSNLLYLAGSLTTTPNGKRGNLVTFRNTNLTSTYQWFYSNRNVYYRNSDNNTSWNEWNRLLIGNEGTVTADFGTIQPMTAVSRIVSIQNLDISQFVTFSNVTVLPSGLIVSYINKGGWQYNIVIFNPTSTEVSVGSQTFKYLWMRNS
jgi:peptidoglycan/xylan/chitin deacetylase (PgdA/CDA1 family)